MLTQQSDPQLIVESMIQRMPQLASCRPALVNGVQRGLRMLATLLVARGRDHQLKASEDTPAVARP